MPVAASTNITGAGGDWVLEIGNAKNLQIKSYSYSLQLDTVHYFTPHTFQMQEPCRPMKRSF